MLVSFAKDIRPLFTDPDIDCMSGLGVELASYDYMSAPAGNAHFPDHANARDVLAHLTGARRPRMPSGGPFWADAQIEIFKQWMADGFLA
jgi:hypothetical protein